MRTELETPMFLFKEHLCLWQWAIWLLKLKSSNSRMWLQACSINSCKMERDEHSRRNSLSSMCEIMRRAQIQTQISHIDKWGIQKPTQKALVLEPGTNTGTFVLHSNIWLTQLLSSTQNKPVVKKGQRLLLPLSSSLLTVLGFPQNSL